MNPDDRLKELRSVLLDDVVSELMRSLSRMEERVVHLETRLSEMQQQHEDDQERLDEMDARLRRVKGRASSSLEPSSPIYFVTPKILE